MLFLTVSALFSILFSLLFTPLFRNLLLHLELVDVGDTVRKIHNRPVPRMGGVAVFGAYVAAVAAAIAIASRLPSGVPLFIRPAIEMLPAATVVFLTGVLDDVRSLRPWQKVAGQTCAALVAVAMGLHFTLADGHFVHRWWGAPLTVIWLVGCTNAYNLIDGVDGLASGVGLIAALSMCAAGLLHGNMGLAAVALPLVGALIGFLRYNYAPASIFLGDCGSLAIGFMLGCCVIILSQTSGSLIEAVAPIIALALPLVDTSVAIARRFVANRPIFGADRGHIHHRLLDRGHLPRAVTLRLYLVCGIAGICSFAVTLFPAYGIAIAAAFCVTAAFWIGRLDYVEFSAVRRVVLSRAVREMLREETSLQHLEKQLSQVGTPEAAWAVLQHCFPRMGVTSLEWRCGERIFRFAGSEHKAHSWSTVTPLSGSDYVSLARDESSGACILAGRLVGILRNYLCFNSGALDSGAFEPGVRFGQAHGMLQLPASTLHRHSEAGETARSAG